LEALGTAFKAEKCFQMALGSKSCIVVLIVLLVFYKVS
jgi:hypothetical protein